jgi:protein-disulfide isomerase
VKAGDVALDVSSNIVIGNPDADAIIVVMVDYCCPKCRQLHAQLRNFKSVSRFDYAVLVLPVPINSSCNQYIRQTDPRNANSCAFAKLALAVWNSDPERFEKFHDWVMQGPSPPAVPDALQYAAQLLRSDNLEDQMESTEVSKQLKGYVEIYNLTGGGQVPRIYIKQWSIHGSPNDQQKMFSAINDLLSRRE